MKKLIVLALAVALMETTVTAQTPSRVYSRPAVPTKEALDRLNLKLAWKAYIPMDGTRDGIATVQVLGDQLFVQTRSGGIIAFNAETGQTLWKAQTASPYKVPFLLGHNYNSIFGLNTTFLFSVERTTGELKWFFDLAGSPSAAPVADAEKLYVPLNSGKVSVFDLTKGPPAANPDDDKAAKPVAGPAVYTAKNYPTSSPQGARSIAAIAVGPYYGLTSSRNGDRWAPELLWDYAAEARLDQSPLLTPRNPDHPGYVLLSSSDGTVAATSKMERRIIHTVVADAAISAPMGQIGADAFIPLKNGTLVAASIETGQIYWRLAVGGTIARRPRTTDEDVYVISTRGGLYRINRKSGDVAWRNGDAERFLAAGKKIVYATDRTGQLLLLDRVRGTKLTSFDTHDFTVPISNEYTDRVYLTGNDGLLICLHDKDNAKPFWSKKFEEDKPIPPKKPKDEEKDPKKEVEKKDKKEEKKDN